MAENNMSIDKLAESYHQNGFVSGINIFSDKEVIELQKNYKEYESTVQKDGLIESYRRYQINQMATWADKVARHPKILDIVSAIFETEDLILWSIDANIKKSKSEGFFSWHQDSTYSGFTPASKFITVWLAVTPSTKESGCVCFLPKTHETQLPHAQTSNPNNMLSLGQTIEDTNFVNSRLPDIFHAELQPGQISIHSSLSVHASGPNDSNQKRVGLALRFLAGDIQRTNYFYKEPVALVKGNVTNKHLHIQEPCKESYSEESFQTHKDIMEKAMKNYFKCLTSQQCSFKSQAV